MILTKIISAKIVELIPIISISLFGALVNVINSPNGFTLKNFFISMLTAGFVGIIIGLIMTDIGFSGGIVAGTAGVSGYSAGKVLDEMQSLLLSKISKSKCNKK